MWYPPCFDNYDKYAEYLEAICFCLVDSDKPENYCSDCTPEYRDEMVAAGRCLYPDTVFLRGARGAVVGYRNPPPITTREVVI